MSVRIKAARMGAVGMRMGGGTYQGDPGLFGFLGKAVKGIASVAGNFAPGPIAGIARAISSRLGNKATMRPTRLPPAVPMIVGGAGGLITSRIAQGFAPPQGTPVPGVRGAIQRILPGGATGFQENGGPPRGYRLNKSDYFLKDGTFVPKGSRYVRIRRRNPLNPRAFDRALGRLESAQKFKDRLGRITIRPKKCK